MRKIDRILPSPRFWEDLSNYRQSKHYPKVRQTISQFVGQLIEGEKTRERGFSNPKLKGVMHIKLVDGLCLMHTYPEPDTLRLCMVVDHSAYGFKGKHKSRETQLAGRILRDVETEAVQNSPEWPDLTWKAPEDIIFSNELQELSIEGLHRVLDSIDAELDRFDKLLSAGKFSKLEDVTDDVITDWGERLIEANDIVCSTLEAQISRRPKPARAVFENWMEP